MIGTYAAADLYEKCLLALQRWFRIKSGGKYSTEIPVIEANKEIRKEISKMMKRQVIGIKLESPGTRAQNGCKTAAGWEQVSCFHSCFPFLLMLSINITEILQRMWPSVTELCVPSNVRILSELSCPSMTRSGRKG